MDILLFELPFLSRFLVFWFFIIPIPTITNSVVIQCIIRHSYPSKPRIIRILD